MGARSMFWRCQWFGAVNVLAQWMFWRGRCFGVVDVLAWSMFWCCQWFGAVNVIALSMCPVNILERLKFWYSCANAGERQSLRDLKYQPHLYTDCTKTLTAPKHRTHRNTDNAGP